VCLQLEIRISDPTYTLFLLLRLAIHWTRGEDVGNLSHSITATVTSQKKMGCVQLNDSCTETVSECACIFAGQVLHAMQTGWDGGEGGQTLYPAFVVIKILKM